VPAEISSGGSHVNNRLPFLTRLKLAFLGGLRAVDEILTCSKKQKKCVAQMAAPQQQKHRRQWYMHRNINPPSNHPTQQQFTLFLSRSSNATSFRFPARSTPRKTASYSPTLSTNEDRARPMVNGNAPEWGTQTGTGESHSLVEATDDEDAVA